MLLQINILENNADDDYGFKKCPYCKCLVEKDNNSNHITCQYCNTEFCWICLSEILSNQNHFAIYNMNGCPGMKYCIIIIYL